VDANRRRIIIKMKIQLISLFLTVPFIFSHCSNNSEANTEDNSIPIINYTYINSFPHDTNSFTEGFLVHKGDLYESTGATAGLSQTKSLFGKVDLKTGEIETKVELDRNKYFGEGITFLNGKVYQLTYKSKIGFIYDASSFKKIGEFTIPTNEGWGLTTDGTNLIMSDGTNTLTFLDPDSLKVLKRISVSESGYLKDNLNELEYINGYIYANLWATNMIVKIEPKSGKVVGKIDLTLLTDEAKSIYPQSLEMNGIAYDSIADKVFVTGKMWPKIYEIKFNH